MPDFARDHGRPRDVRSVRQHIRAEDDQALARRSTSHPPISVRTTRPSSRRTGGQASDRVAKTASSSTRCSRPPACSNGPGSRQEQVTPMGAAMVPSRPEHPPPDGRARSWRVSSGEAYRRARGASGGGRRFGGGEGRRRARAPATTAAEARAAADARRGGRLRPKRPRRARGGQAEAEARREAEAEAAKVAAGKSRPSSTVRPRRSPVSRRPRRPRRRRRGPLPGGYAVGEKGFGGEETIGGAQAHARSGRRGRGGDERRLKRVAVMFPGNTGTINASSPRSARAPRARAGTPSARRSTSPGRARRSPQAEVHREQTDTHERRHAHARPVGRGDGAPVQRPPRLRQGCGRDAGGEQAQPPAASHRHQPVRPWRGARPRTRAPEPPFSGGDRESYRACAAKHGHLKVKEKPRPPRARAAQRVRAPVSGLDRRRPPRRARGRARATPVARARSAGPAPASQPGRPRLEPGPATPRL